MSSYMIGTAICGYSLSIAVNSHATNRAQSTGSVARTVAVRACSSMSASSPKKSPGSEVSEKAGDLPVLELDVGSAAEDDVERGRGRVLVNDRLTSSVRAHLHPLCQL